MAVKATIGAIGALLLAAVLMLSVTAKASALIEVEATNIAAGEHSAVAKCPQGKHIVSGGGWIGTFQMSLGQPDFAGMTKVRNGWKVSGDPGMNPSDPFRVTSYAYCSNHNFHLRKSAKESTHAPDVTTRARCKRGTDIISGGGLFTSDYGISQVSARFNNGWKLGSDTTLDGGSIGLPATTEAQAYCTPESYDIHQVRIFGRVEPGHIKSRTARCPRGMKLVSGGADAVSPRGLLWFMRAAGNGWTGTVTNYDSTETITMVVYAYCH